MLRDIMKIKKVKAPGTADFKAAVADLGLTESQRLATGDIVLLELKDANGVNKSLAGAKAVWADSGANLAITKATVQAANDVYTIGLCPGTPADIVTGT